jgi:hypothetical protein
VITLGSTTLFIIIISSSSSSSRVEAIEAYFAFMGVGNSSEDCCYVKYPLALLRALRRLSLVIGLPPHCLCTCRPFHFV